MWPSRWLGLSKNGNLNLWVSHGLARTNNILKESSRQNTMSPRRMTKNWFTGWGDDGAEMLRLKHVGTTCYLETQSDGHFFRGRCRTSSMHLMWLSQATARRHNGIIYYVTIKYSAKWCKMNIVKTYICNFMSWWKGKDMKPLRNFEICWNKIVNQCSSKS